MRLLATPRVDWELRHRSARDGESRRNASLTGDVSLNTIAWDYAPWLQRFGRQLMRRWIPPTAYTMGLLKEGGWAQIEIEISRSGRMLTSRCWRSRGTRC
jgi:hypothetical protein